MSLLPQLRARLIYSRSVTEEQMVAAEQFARKNYVPLEKALVDLQFSDYAKLGKALSELTELPYHPLLGQTFSPEIFEMIGPKWALRWGALPVSYDPVPHLLTIAVSAPDVVSKIRNLYRFFMEPYSLAFTIASDCEIRSVLEKRFGAAGPQDGSLAPTTPGGAPAASAARAPGGADARQRLPLFSKGARPSALSKPQAVDETGPYLIGAAALLVAAHLGEDSARLREIRERVRYCQLLANRLNFLPHQVSRVVMAAWLSSLMEKPDVVRQFATPYNLEEILFSKETDKAKLPSEGLALDLILRYEDVKKRDSAACREVTLVRRTLHLLWSSAQADQPMLETFLQILMDEQFLSKLDRGAGHILIVDPAGFSSSGIAPLLTNDGYDVSVVPTGEAAWESIQQHSCNLVICGMLPPQNSGVALCRKIKGNAPTARMPFLFVITRDEEKRAAECLRVGADDILVKPVDPELLFLKLQKLMKAPADESARDGVAGKLEDMSFTDMIQILSAGSKNMEVQLAHQGQEGRVFLKEGNVIHATAGQFQGEDAFYQLMKWREGSFITKSCAEFPAATIQASTTSLLMEGARLADETGEEPELPSSSAANASTAPSMS